MPPVLGHVAWPTDDARALIGELDAELSGAYAPVMTSPELTIAVFRFRENKITVETRH